MAPSSPNRYDAAIRQQHRHLQTDVTAARPCQQSDQALARRQMIDVLNRPVNRRRRT